MEDLSKLNKKELLELASSQAEELGAIKAEAEAPKYNGNKVKFRPSKTVLAINAKQKANRKKKEALKK